MVNPILGWILLFAPAFVCAGIILMTRRSWTLSAGLAIGAMGLSFLCSALILWQLSHALHAIPSIQSSVPWVVIPGAHDQPTLSLEFGIGNDFGL